MTWGTQRRNRILAYIILIFFLLLFVLLWFLFYRPPSCSDKKQNGNEDGVDCGGPCEILCKKPDIEPFVRWTRFIETRDKEYIISAYVENQNVEVGTIRAPYSFNLIDEKNTLIKTLDGQISLYPQEVVPIVWTGVSVDRPINRIDFNFKDKVVWKKMDKREIALVVTEDELSKSDENIILKGNLINNIFDDLTNVELIGMLFDNDGNIITLSSTYFERIKQDSSVNFIFTWKDNFTVPVARYTILPVYEYSK
jgi:hypothetical protein